MKWILMTMLLGVAAAHGQLVVTVFPPKVVGQKAVVPVVLKHGFSERIESARAVCFLLDEQGMMAGQSTKWVVGGSAGSPGVAPGATNRFHFVITSSSPAGFPGTNLSAKVSFSRVVLEDGSLADPNRDVQIQAAAR